jgi:PAS domain S-box-containing protein
MWTCEEIKSIAFNYANDGIFVHGVMKDKKPGKFIEVNYKGCLMTGYTKEELLNLTPLQIDETPPNVANKAMQRLFQDMHVIFETILVTKTGNKIPIEISNYLLTEKEDYFIISIVRDITERKRGEEELFAAKSRLEYLLTSSPAVIYKCKPSGDYAANFISENVKDQMGYEPDDFTSEASFWADRIHPDDAPRIFEGLKALFEKGTLVHEYRFLCKDGSYRWMHDELNLMRDKDGNPFEIVGSWHDITERKLAEEALWESKEKYRMLVELAQEGIWAIDKDACTTFVNPRMATMLGYTVDEMQGVHLFSFMDEKGVEIAKQNLERRKQGIEEQHDFEFIRKDGSRIYTSIETNPLYDYGNYIGALACVADITERRRAEEALRESKEKVRLLLDSTAEAIYGVDRDGNCTFCNSSFLRHMRYEKEEDLLGKNMHKLIHHTHVDGTEYPVEKCKIYESLVKGEGVSVDEEVLWRADGSSFYVEYWSYPMYKGNEIIGAVVSFTDITERKQAEAKMKMLTEELKRSNQELKQFAAVAAHDLQSPLLAFISALRLLERKTEGKLDQEAEEYISHIKDRSSSMLTVIRSLLEYAHMNTSSSKFKLVNSEAILKGALVNLMADIESRGVVIIHDQLPEIMGDAPLLTQVLQNLISNAIKFCDKEPPEVHISAKKRGMEWVFSVKDNGVGIEPKYAKRIFEIFQRAHARGSYSGTGIGLATCKKIVELHGGRIWVKSEPGKGSTFFFAIPQEEPQS